MPIFSGFATNTNYLVGGLETSALGAASSALTPLSLIGGTGLGGSSSLIGQLLNGQSNVNRRVSLKAKPAAANTILGNGLLAPLKTTGNGMIWPYTPSISYNHNVNYQQIQTVHANQDFHVFSNTPAVEFTVDGAFTVQNQMEGQYAFACLHFLRTVTKMNFGQLDSRAGTPPPVLLFSAYGPFMFNNAPVIVKSFSCSFPDDVDYVEVGINGSNSVTNGSPGAPGGAIAQALSSIFGANSSASAAQPTTTTTSTSSTPSIFSSLSGILAGPTNYIIWLPSMFKISCNLVIQHTPNTLQTRFNLPAFINGASNQSDFV